MSSTGMSWDSENMKVTIRKILQGICVVLCFVYISVAAWNNLVTSQNQEVVEIPQQVFQERLPRSIEISENKIDNNLRDNSVVRSKFLMSLAQTTPPSRKKLPGNTLDDIFISVKTTEQFHKSRLDIILKTWFTLAKEQTYFFTDADDQEYQQKTNGHMINTNCSSSHNRKALCCKMSVELDTFLESNKKWFCHFDDDNYVNVPRLVRLLQGFNPLQDWYIGKPSIRAPLEILNRDHPMNKKLSFWFATGGAGFCISRSLALKMMPLASGGKFISIGEKIRLPDDVTMGYIIEHLLKKSLHVVEEFHSHLEPMRFLDADSFADQITFSYSRFGKEDNVVNIDGFSMEADPTRFLSIHCLLFPHYSFCPG